MSHFTVVVVGDDIEGALAPYDENIEAEPRWEVEAQTPAQHWATEGWIKEGLLPTEPTFDDLLRVIKQQWTDEGDMYRVHEDRLERETTYNPLSKWDWYQVGGRRSGFFLTARGEVDSCKKKEILWETLREDAKREAERAFDQLATVTKGIDHPGQWTHFVERHLGELAGIAYQDLTEKERKLHGQRVNEARKAFHEHPFNVALSQASMHFFFSDVAEEFCLEEDDPREAYIKKQVRGVCVPFAFVVDGKWIERGEVGWFGMARNEMPEVAWDAQAAEIWESIPDDATVTLVDCHI